MSRAARWLALASLLGLASIGPACGGAPDEAATDDEDVTGRGKIQLLVTVDWEGRDLRDENLAAMKDLRARFADVKIVHFLNAAYFTKEGADASETREKIGSVLADGDEKGLHIHGWKRLFEAAGVTFRTSPTFWGTSLRPTECESDCGHEVPISLYEADELAKVVRFSLDTLEANGFGRAKSFRCGGWMAKDSVREAIAREGLVYDESAVPTTFLAPKLGTYPVYDWLDELWSGTTSTSQPYTLPTEGGELVEVPDNGALADYVTAGQMVDVFRANVEAWRRDRRRNVVVSIGFHEETAARYLPELESALEQIREIAGRERIPMESVTTERVKPR